MSKIVITTEEVDTDSLCGKEKGLYDAGYSDGYFAANRSTFNLCLFVFALSFVAGLIIGVAIK